MPDKDLLATDPVTFEELRRFARDWRKYARWLKEGNNQYKAVAYLGVSRRLDYPVAVVRWADEHGWAADRFFLLERKFRLTLSVLRQQERRANLTGHLQRRIEETRANSSLSPEQKKQQLSQFYRSIREIQKATQARRIRTDKAEQDGVGNDFKGLTRQQRRVFTVFGNNPARGGIH